MPPALELGDTVPNTRTSANDATLTPPLHGHNVVEKQSTTEHDPCHTSHEFSAAASGGGGGEDTMR